jgi:hypothetical protein
MVSPWGALDGGREEAVARFAPGNSFARLRHFEACLISQHRVDNICIFFAFERTGGIYQSPRCRQRAQRVAEDTDLESLQSRHI